jgi:cytochrome bd-type quinol oxidase subunit 2
MGLQIFWFIVIAFFWTGFFILEGFDLGVGALHMVVGKTDIERRVAINSIGPFWDGNEVWLIVAGAGMFAAFPNWYASMFSALYLALMLVILALIIRGLSFEYRGKVTSPRWRETWSWLLTIGSVLLPVLFGVALGDLLHGLPIDKNGDYTGSFIDLLQPYGIWVGVTLLAITLAHGAMYLSIKTTGTVQQRSARLSGRGVIPGFLNIAAILLVIGAAWAVREGHGGWGFAATTATMGASVASLFVALYPNVFVSTTDKSYNITVANSASGSYALTTMTVVAVIFAPLVIAYQAWSYHVFRGRIRGPAVAAGDAGAAATAPSATETATTRPAPETESAPASSGPETQAGPTGDGAA